MKRILDEEDFELGRMYWVRHPLKEGQTNEDRKIDFVECTIKEEGRVILDGNFIYHFSEYQDYEFVGPEPEPVPPDFDTYLKEENVSNHSANNENH